MNIYETVFKLGSTLESPGELSTAIEIQIEFIYDMAWVSKFFQSSPRELIQDTPETGASFVAQLVKNLPAIQDTPVLFLGQGNPLEKG